jgi:hypothetical protein
MLGLKPSFVELGFSDLSSLESIQNVAPLLAYDSHVTKLQLAPDQQQHLSNLQLGQSEEDGLD